MAEFVGPRREPAKPRKISEIKIGDSRVRLLGTVVNKKEAEFVLDDGSGQITVVFDDPALIEGVYEGSRVRVFGSPLNVGGAHEFHAEIVQKADQLDFELYEEVMLELKKFEKELEK